MSTAVALQRLRQGQGRCQQLASLLQWHQQAGGPATAREQQRGAADQATAFARERKGFERSLGELRKQWAKERLEKEAARAVAEAAERCAARRRSTAARCSALPPALPRVAACMPVHRWHRHLVSKASP